MGRCRVSLQVLLEKHGRVGSLAPEQRTAGAEGKGPAQRSGEGGRRLVWFLQAKSATGWGVMMGRTTHQHGRLHFGGPVPGLMRGNGLAGVLLWCSALAQRVEVAQAQGNGNSGNNRNNGNNGNGNSANSGNNGNGNSGNNGNNGNNGNGNGNPNVDCVGSWSACDVNCEKYFGITTQQSGNGNACAAQEGAMETCAAGEGQCPQSMRWHWHNTAYSRWTDGTDDVAVLQSDTS
eukprot:COSAG02_NODE_10678_length_1884_cov_104.592717_1_plen_233_part_10